MRKLGLLLCLTGALATAGAARANDEIGDDGCAQVHAVAAHLAHLESDLAGIPQAVRDLGVDAVAVLAADADAVGRARRSRSQPPRRARAAGAVASPPHRPMAWATVAMAMPGSWRSPVSASPRRSAT